MRMARWAFSFSLAVAVLVPAVMCADALDCHTLAVDDGCHAPAAQMEADCECGSATAVLRPRVRTANERSLDSAYVVGTMPVARLTQSGVVRVQSPLRSPPKPGRDLQALFATYLT